MVVDHNAINKILGDTTIYQKNVPNKFLHQDDFDEQRKTVLKWVFGAENMAILNDQVVDMADKLLDQLVDSQGNGVSFNVHETSLSVSLLKYALTFHSLIILYSSQGRLWAP